MVKETLLPTIQDVKFLQKKMGAHNMVEKSTLFSNVWYDDYGIKYELKNYGALIITIDNFFVPPTIISYINKLPESIGFVYINYKLKADKIEYLKAFIDVLQYVNYGGLVLLWMGKNVEFSQSEKFDFSRLPKNIKITNLMGEHNKEQEFMGENSFDWWSLNLSDEEFTTLCPRLTKGTRDRAVKMRSIAKSFYDSFPRGYIASLTSVKRANEAYDWVRKNTVYDMSVINSDGTLKKDSKYSQDPIVTYETGRGVCAGRARLMKVLLNNCYMRVPCFLTNGNYGTIYHEWNEVHDKNDVVYYYDLSSGIKGANYIPMCNDMHHKFDHSDYFRNRLSTNKRHII